MVKLRKHDKLMEEAFEHIDNGGFNKSIRIGKKLQQMGYTGGFEIEALALYHMGKYNKSIEVVEKGLKIGPDIWMFWQLLGNNYSEKKLFKQSFAAYEKGLSTTIHGAVSLNYNFANALERSGDLSAAQERIAKIYSDKMFPYEVDKSLYFHILSLHYTLLNNEGKYEKTIASYKKENKDALECCEETRKLKASVLTEVATAYFMLYEIDLAFKYLKEAIDLDKHNLTSQWLYREMNVDNGSSYAKRFKIMVDGQWYKPLNDSKVKPKFSTVYDIIASNINEAKKIIEDFEPLQVHASLTIEVLEENKQSSNLPIGVYHTNEYFFYIEA